MEFFHNGENGKAHFGAVNPLLNGRFVLAGER